MQKNTSQLLDQEKIYALLAKKDWSNLLSFVWSNSSIIASDEILKYAINLCEETFFSNINEEKAKNSFTNNLATFHALHIHKKHFLSEENFRITTIELIKDWESKDLLRAKSFAEYFPEEEICKQIIEKYENSLPKRIIHSQSNRIELIENRDVSKTDGRCSLFKSKQEKEFFLALIESFPNCTVYPNVSLNSIVNFDVVKTSLANEERDYFFKAILDSVVFDHHNELYLPIYFFELDSIYHDTDEQKRKDKIKDKILALAGQKLLRIRSVNTKSTKAKFAQLIKEILNSSK